MTDSLKIGKYDLLGLIAQGGMGNVYLARAEGLAGFTKLVVVKTLRHDLADDARFREMFLDEARLAARLNHRNVVQTNDVGEADGVYFMVMDYLEGRSLAKIQKYLQKKSEPKLPLALEVRVVADMLAGLHYAHELQDFDGKPLGVVHRDVCPANVFVTTDGQVKVVDFGVAKAKNQSHETQAGTIKGRIAYMSPEHVTGKGIDRRADVFSAGIMLWEAIEGQRFWGGAGEAEILGRLLRGDFPVLTRPDVPDALRDACARALTPDAEGRYPTAHAMRLALEEWLSRNEDRSALVDLGAKIPVWFAEERARVAAAVEAAMSPSRKPADLPQLEAAPAPGTPPESSISNSQSRSAVSKATGTVTATAPSATSPFVATGDVPPPKPGSKGAIVGAILAGAVVVAAALAFGMSRRGEPSSAAPAPSGPPAEEAKVKLTIKVTPAAAHIFVDEKPVDGNPYVATFPKGSGKHLVRAEAAGFAPKSELVDLGESMQVSLALEPAPTAAPVTTKVVVVPAKGGPVAVVPPSPGGPAAAPATAPPAAPGLPQPGVAPVHTVDPSNPYARPSTGRGVDPNNPYAK